MVIGIIALLAALVFPAINGALKKGQKAQAQAAVNSIEGALLMFFDEYRRWPDAPNGEGSQGNQMEKEIVQILIGRKLDSENKEVAYGASDTALAQNPKRIKFLDIPREALNSQGQYVDPWDNMYKFMCDYDYDNFVSTTTSGGQQKSVVVWSRGVDGSDVTASEQKDDPRSWTK